MVDWFELKRKTIHFSLGILLLLLVYFDLLKWWMALLVGVTWFSWMILYRRYPAFFFSKLTIKTMHTFERKEHEHYPGIGVYTIFFSLAVILLLFEKNIVLAALLIWMIGDGFSALVGKHWKIGYNPFNSRRSLSGLVVGIVLATIAALFFIPWYVALFASIIALIIESFDVSPRYWYLNDNVLMPIISAVIIWLVLLL